MSPKSKKLTSMLTLLVAFTFIIKARAETQDIMPKRNIEQVAEQRCSLITQRIENKLEIYKTNQDKHDGVYTNLYERLNKLVELGKDKSYEVSKLEGDLDILKEKIKMFNDNYTTYLEKLEETKKYVCGNSEGEFVNKLVNARQELKNIRDSSMEIRNYFQSVIKPDIQILSNNNLKD